jgi:hypothetical protein
MLPLGIFIGQLLVTHFGLGVIRRSMMTTFIDPLTQDGRFIKELWNIKELLELVD